MLKIDPSESVRSIGHVASRLGVPVQAVEEVARALNVEARRMNDVVYFLERDADAIGNILRSGRVPPGGMPTLIA